MSAICVEKLVQAGCRRIGYWRAISQFRIVPLSYFQDYLGGKDVAAHAVALEHAGVPYYPELMRPHADMLEATGDGHYMTHKSHQQQGYEAAMAVFGGDPAMRPDGLVITDDMMTSGALVALEKLGLTVGKDVRIAAHANVDTVVLFGRKDSLILVELDPGDIVRAMFDYLDQVLGGAKIASTLKVVEPKNC
jgi:DNA-binding LacI/PurR family transcriptional regulator